MPTTVLENIKGDQIPSEWLEKVKGGIDQIFDITIKPKSNEDVYDDAEEAEFDAAAREALNSDDVQEALKKLAIHSKTRKFHKTIKP